MGFVSEGRPFGLLHTETEEYQNRPIKSEYDLIRKNMGYTLN